MGCGVGTGDSLTGVLFWVGDVGDEDVLGAELLAGILRLR